MLAAGRQAMVNRAVRSFQSQTYGSKVLAILDNGPAPLDLGATFEWNKMGIHVTRMMPHANEGRRSIGELRNLANALACGGALDAPIIAHWDSDDWSAPERLSEQVELLQSSGALATGYHEALFWDSTKAQIEVDPSKCGPEGVGALGTVKSAGQAWLYSSPNPIFLLGTSLCYWRSIWEKIPFAHVNTAEDLGWINKLKAKDRVAVSSLRPEPRMIASIHGGNTTAKIVSSAREWSRAPEWDAVCMERMKL